MYEYLAFRNLLFRSEVIYCLLFSPGVSLLSIVQPLSEPIVYYSAPECAYCAALERDYCLLFSPGVSVLFIVQPQSEPIVYCSAPE